MVDLHVGGQGIAPIEAVNSLFFSPGAEWESERGKLGQKHPSFACALRLCRAEEDPR